MTVTAAAAEMSKLRNCGKSVNSTDTGLLGGDMRGSSNEDGTQLSNSS